MNITLSISELEDLLVAQKNSTAEYITRNLSTYSFFNEYTGDLGKAKDEMKRECIKSGYPSDFNVLKKYIK